MDGRTGIAGCELLVTFLHYFGLTNFFWMMVEGLWFYHFPLPRHSFLSFATLIAIFLEGERERERGEGKASAALGIRLFEIQNRVSDKWAHLRKAQWKQILCIPCYSNWNFLFPLFFSALSKIHHRKRGCADAAMCGCGNWNLFIAADAIRIFIQHNPHARITPRPHTHTRARARRNENLRTRNASLADIVLQACICTC